MSFHRESLMILEIGNQEPAEFIQFDFILSNEWARTFTDEAQLVCMSCPTWSTRNSITFEICRLNFAVVRQSAILITRNHEFIANKSLSEWRKIFRNMYIFHSSYMANFSREKEQGVERRREDVKNIPVMIMSARNDLT